MQVTEEGRNHIALKSVGQFDNSLYETHRHHRLTSSLFGKIIKRKNYTPCHRHIVDILYRSVPVTNDMSYGIVNEKVVLKKLQDEFGISATPSGLFVDLEYGFLATSPDELIDTDGLIEIKCLPSVSRAGAY
ncbi:YqaJ-like viral recombinase domain [Popillia japonica]|uniref:YqaJ-like viral recombinase domain n=1 Tax=Popillia japonica TaxID=7064 RepID=A0AAW1HFP2_POPJA